jgi:ABC-type Zn2+ transport system substrate-binding protein/surface adhesin
MEKVKNAPTNKEKTAAVEQHKEANHTERIKSQVLAKIGKPPRLDRVEVSRHHHGNYRVNIWEQPESNKNFAVTISPRIRSSYYLTVSDAGEIVHSNPPLTKLGSST